MPTRRTCKSTGKMRRRFGSLWGIARWAAENRPRCGCCFIRTRPIIARRSSAYSDDFPRYFRPALPRGPYEGAFWYHHIQAHPDFDEMARQDVRFIWASFWFTHLGEYLPEATEWAPYTYAKWWSLKERMSDERINAFIRDMHQRKIGVFAYFNVTEYGGSGGQGGDPEAASRILREQFAESLIKDVNGQPIPTWEGAMAMNARRDGPFFAALAEQLRRHITRLPQLDGFTIDRLDWASIIDYGHDDGLTMIGNRPVQNMVGPVAEGIAEVCRQAHAAGWRVYVNHIWRIEVLRDNDGYCDESDHVRGLHYVSAFRPASAWNLQIRYDGDLLPFEAQLKRRLQFAVFPQMIAHKFPISQQDPNPNAADLLELYAPLFSMLAGKEQVLLPHCVSVSGANDANLFVNQTGNFVVPVTSRVRFLSRPTTAAEQSRCCGSACPRRRSSIGLTSSPPMAAPLGNGRARFRMAKITFDQHGSLFDGRRRPRRSAGTCPPSM